MRASKRDARWTAAVIFSVAVASVPLAAQGLGNEPARASGASGSIKVSGYWNVDVHNADGTLASHTEFENELTPAGGIVLGKLLAGSVTVRDLMVVLDGSHPCGKPCVIAPNNQDFPTFGLIYVGSNSTTSDPAVSMTLSVGAQTAGSPKLVLSGLATTSDGTISKVRTVAVAQCPTDLTLCDPVIKSLIGGSNTAAIFAAITSTLTEFTLPGAGLTVTAGQVVSVSITLTFSS